jgi:hypothetical protein
MLKNPTRERGSSEQANHKGRATIKQPICGREMNRGSRNLTGCAETLAHPAPLARGKAKWLRRKKNRGER